uniref:Neurotransmitter-gated ion-channel ligand-binding domain-containing protein n=1 Tax=Meloidogyne javanica TaxID=6303 RepID=A0A915LYY7_MELJA
MPKPNNYCFLWHLGHLTLFLLISKLNAQQKQQLRSVPIPLHMDEMLSAGRQDFQLDVYLQQFWKDPRLAHNEKSRILIRDRAILNRIWHPDVYFAKIMREQWPGHEITKCKTRRNPGHARIAQFHEVTQPNFLLWIDPDGSILYDTRVSMVVICAMNLKNFPLDSQWCHLRILSYAYDIHHLKIEWVDQEPITKNVNITMSDMDIVKLVPGTCDGNYSTATMAAAGLLDEKEENGHSKSGCVAFLYKILHQFCKHKRLILSKEQSWTKSEESKTKSSFWHNWKSNRLKRQMLVDIEEGKVCDGNSGKEENNFCTNRKRSSAKKLIAIEKEVTTPNSYNGWGNSPQLQLLCTKNLNRHEKLIQNPFSNVPLIVCNESEDEEEENERNNNEVRKETQPKQRNAVDQREAARLANWAKPELSCEALLFQGSRTEDMSLESQSEYSSDQNKLKRAVSTLFSSNYSPQTIITSRKQSTVPLKVESSPTKSAMGLEPPISRPLSRRASAMASLLDPINIGSGERRESFTSTTPNVGSQTSGDNIQQTTLTPRSKWRHAIRKLQMNK